MTEVMGVLLNKFKRGDFLLIEWEDPCEAELSDPDDIERVLPMRCKTIGWYINHDERYLRMSYEQKAAEVKVFVLPLVLIINLGRLGQEVI